MERIGIIDLGSNTTRLVVLEYRPDHSYRLVDEVSESVRLAEGMSADGILQPEPMQRAIDTLKMFHTFCRSSNVGHIVAVGTSAVRSASNQAEFLDMLKRDSGITLRVLSGEEEAYYGYLGVINSLPITNGYIIDIGGGSTEVTEIYRRSFSRAFSQHIGIVRVTEQYVHSDPISKQDFHLLEEAVAKEFAKLQWLKTALGYVLVGVGGTVRNLARMAQKQQRHPLDRIHGYVLTLEMIDTLIGMMRRRDISERKNIAGLNKERADVMLAGAVILRQLMDQGDFEEIVVSGEGIREGLFYEHFLGTQEKPLLENVRSFNIKNLTHLYHYEEQHAQKVQELSLSLFDQLRPLHNYGAWERELLAHAALLHDIGVTVGYYDHHKHSSYLVLNSVLRGFNHREIVLLAFLSRLHRKGTPSTSDYQAILAVDDTERVLRLGAILRIAEYLERSKSQVIENVHVDIDNNNITINVESQGDATVEIWDANRRSTLLANTFKCNVKIV